VCCLKKLSANTNYLLSPSPVESQQGYLLFIKLKKMKQINVYYLLASLGLVCCFFSIVALYYAGFNAGNEELMLAIVAFFFSAMITTVSILSISYEERK